MIMLVSHYRTGSASVTDFGKILAALGFVIYVAGRIWHQRVRKADSQPDRSRAQERS
jgi:hypothetical protein